MGGGRVDPSAYQTLSRWDGWPGGRFLASTTDGRQIGPASQPLTIDSDHCIGSTVETLQQLLQGIQANPEGFVQNQILPQLLDHGTYEIQFEGPMIPGRYRGGMVVEGPTWMHVRIRVVDGRPEGTIDFYPGVIKEDAILGFGDVTLSQIQIVTDPETHEIQFKATATFLNIEQDATEDMTEILLGRRMESVPGPLSHLVRMIQEHARRVPPENMVNLQAARFRIVANPQPGDTPLPGLGDVSRARLHWDRIQISPKLVLSDITAGIEVSPNLETGGFRVVIPEARIGNIHHDPGVPCGGQPNIGLDASRLRVQDVALELVPRDPQNFLAGMYVKSGGGRILSGGLSINDDIVLAPMEDVTFTLAGQSNGDLSAVVNVPEVLLDRAAVELGGQMLNDRTMEVGLDDLALRNGQFTVDLKGGEIYYNGRITPSLAATTLAQHDLSDQLLLSANLMGLQCEPITAGGTVGAAGRGSHRVTVPACDLAPSSARWFEPLPNPGNASLQFNDLGLEATFGSDGLRIERAALPDYLVQSTASVNGRRVSTSITDGPKGTVPAGLTLVADATGPTSSATINTSVQRLRFETPQGTFEMTGNLAGKVRLVDIRTDPSQPPAFRPVAGSLSLELRNGTVSRIVGGRRLPLLSHRISIEDDPSGRIVLRGRANLTDPTLPLDHPHVTPHVNIDLSPAVRVFQDFPYYEPSAVDTVSIPSFVLNLFEGHVGTFTATGNATVTGIQGGHPHVDFQARLPFGHRQITANEITVETDGGRIRATGTEERINVRVRPPETVQIRFRQQQEGITYEFDGQLTSTADFRATVDVTHQRVTFHQTTPAGQRPLTGTMTVTARNAEGEVVGAGEVELATNYEVSGHMADGLAHFSLKTPETGVTGRVTQPMTIAGIQIPVGSELSIPIRGFEGKGTVNPLTLQLNSRWTAADLGPAAISIPGSPLANFRQLPLQGPLTLRFTGEAHGQGFTVDASPTGISLNAVTPTRTYNLLLRAIVGQDLDLPLNSETRADGIAISVDPTTYVTDVDLNDLSLLSRIAGHLNLPGLPLDLTGMETQGALQGLRLHIDPTSGEIRLGVVPYEAAPVTYPPTDLDSWLAWTADDWRRYRDVLNDPARRHLAVLSEQNANLPGSPFPHGRGKIYIDTEPKEYVVDLDDVGGNVLAAVSNLVGQLWGDLEIRREWPNPPIPSPPPPESMIYNAGQDALFILNPGDSELVDRIQYGLGITNDEARRLFQNGRIDMDILLQAPALRENFPPEVIRGLVGAYFNAQDPANRSFTNNTHRFFLALGDLRTGLPRLVGLHEEYWNPQVRSVIPRNFDEASFQGNGANGDGLNMTAYAYLPYSPERVLGIMGGMGDYQYWVPWTEDSSAAADGSFTGSLLGRDYRVTGQRSSFGPIQVFSYQQPSQDAGFETFAGRILLVPKTNERGEVIGTFVIQQQAIDFKGRETKIYTGRDEDLNPLGNPARPLFSTRNPYWIDIAMIGHRTNRITEPNRNPAEILPYRLARGISNLYTLLTLNRAPSEMDFRDYKANPQSLSLAPDGVVGTARPGEFMTLTETTQGGTTARTLTLNATPANRSRISTLLKDGLGIDQAQADQMIAAGQITIQELAELPFLKKAFEPATVESLARLMLQENAGINVPFVSRSERFLLFLKDMRTRWDQWTDKDGDGVRDLDFRSFPPERFHVLSSHNRSRSDGTDSICYTVFPGDVSAEALLESFSRPEDFRQYSSDYISAANATCEQPKPGRRCVDSHMDLVVDEVYCRIEIPAELVHVGNVGIAPWTWAHRPDIPDSQQGFEENEGFWVLIPLRDNQGTLVMRYGLLNTRLTGDAALAQTAFERVPSFLEGVHRETKRRVTGNPSATGARFRFGQVFTTAE